MTQRNATEAGIPGFNREEIEDFVADEARSDADLGLFVEARGRDQFRLGPEPELALNPTAIDLFSLKSLYFLVRHTQSLRTIETGFGFGVSAATILLAKQDKPRQFHCAIDPTDLPHSSPRAILSRLQARYGSAFEMIRQPSELALPRLVAENVEPFDLAFVDGNHLFEGALIDFVFLDRLCRVGGVIVLDDILFPAVASALNFVERNRQDYQVTRLRRLAVLQKTGHDDRAWNHFEPFETATGKDLDRAQAVFARHLRAAVGR